MNDKKQSLLIFFLSSLKKNNSFIQGKFQEIIINLSKKILFEQKKTIITNKVITVQI